MGIYQGFDANKNKCEISIEIWLTCYSDTGEEGSTGARDVFYRQGKGTGVVETGKKRTTTCLL
jgi:hypothetical protein